MNIESTKLTLDEWKTVVDLYEQDFLGSYSYPQFDNYEEIAMQAASQLSLVDSKWLGSYSEISESPQTSLISNSEHKVSDVYISILRNDYSSTTLCVNVVLSDYKYDSRWKKTVILPVAKYMFSIVSDRDICGALQDGLNNIKSIIEKAKVNRNR